MKTKQLILILIFLTLGLSCSKKDKPNQQANRVDAGFIIVHEGLCDVTYNDKNEEVARDCENTDK